MAGPRGIALALACAGAIAVASVGVFSLANRASPIKAAGPAAWTEVSWPFPIDEWGTGKAFQCSATDCGNAVDVYLRSKIGFCNCATGVADDSELERLSDFNLLGGKPVALASGGPVDIAWMKGRSRAYAMSGFLDRGSMISVAFSNDCDALVATAVLRQGRASDIEARVIAFLNSEIVVRWAKAELGL